MLEIIAIVLLCNTNKKNAIARGRKPGVFMALTIVLWIGLEMVGMLIGQAAELDVGAYALAIVFAIGGGAASYFITKNCKPGTFVDPQIDIDAQAPTTTTTPDQRTYAVSQQVKQASVPKAAPQQAEHVSLSTAAKFCPVCGTPFLENAKFCRKCGAPRPTAPASEPAVATQKSGVQMPTPAAQTVTPSTTVADDALKRNSTLALVAGVIFTIGCLAFAVGETLTHRVICLTAESFLAYALLGVAVYLICQPDKRSRTTAGVFGAIAALFATESAIPAVLHPRATYLAYMRFGIIFLVILACFAIALAVAFAINKWRENDTPTRRFIMGSGIAACAIFLIDLASKFIRQRLFNFFYMPEMPSDYFAIGPLLTAAVMFLVALLIFLLCSSARKN